MTTSSLVGLTSVTGNTGCTTSGVLKVGAELIAEIEAVVAA